MSQEPVAPYVDPIYPNNSQTFSTPDGPGTLNLINPNDATVEYTIAWDGELPTTYSMRHGHEEAYRMPKGTTAVVTNLGPYALLAQFATVPGDEGGE